MKKMITRLLVFAFLFSCTKGLAQQHVDITVASDGTGDYESITKAIENLPMYTYERVVIFIKNGVYEEKFRIERDNLTFVGEDRERTVIQYNQLRSDWVENKDIIGPAVVNIHADDIVMKNLTIVNTQPQIGPHAFTIYGTGTRTVLKNCTVTSKGGDTVSLWNYKEGMYYHTDCHFEGAVDFVCPRGWCFIDNSTFYEVKKTATIWHAAPQNEKQKFVIRNSAFDGIEGFQLGRHHYEARFYLVDCSYSSKMADKPIYRVTYADDPKRDRPYVWGDRKYFYGSKKEGAKYDWLSDNIQNSDSITAKWTFDGAWDPESVMAPRCISQQLAGDVLTLVFSDEMTIRGDLKIKSKKGNIFTFESGRGRKTLTFMSESKSQKSDEYTLVSGELLATQASAEERSVKTIVLNQ